MSWRNPKWRYADAEETREPGYLARKFKKMQRKQNAAPQESVETLTQPYRVPEAAGGPPAVSAPKIRRVA